MIIKFSPQGGYDISTRIEVIDENSLIINETIYQIPTDLVSVDPLGSIMSGIKQSDGWHLTILFRYSDGDKAVWETPPYRGIEEEAWSPNQYSIDPIEQEAWDSLSEIAPSAPNGRDLSSLPMIVCTGKTQAHLDAESIQARVADVKSQLSSLDSVIKRHEEDDLFSRGVALYDGPSETMTAFQAIAKKNELRQQIRELTAT